MLGCLTASAVVAVWLAAWTHRHRSDLTAPAKWLGYGPAAFVLAALFALVALLRY